MQKGFAVPVILILSVLLILPIFLWFTTTDLNYSTSDSSVKGVSTLQNSFQTPGFSVKINSEASNWKLRYYLCETKEQCLIDLDSGFLSGTINGGKTQDHQVIIQSTPSWKDYEFVKLVMTSDSGKNFEITNKGDYFFTEVIPLSTANNEVFTVFLETNNLTKGYFSSVTFSDFSAN